MSFGPISTGDTLYHVTVLRDIKSAIQHFDLEKGKSTDGFAQTLGDIFHRVGWRAPEGRWSSLGEQYAHRLPVWKAICAVLEKEQSDETRGDPNDTLALKFLDFLQKAEHRLEPIHYLSLLLNNKGTKASMII